MAKARGKPYQGFRGAQGGAAAPETLMRRPGTANSPR